MESAKGQAVEGQPAPDFELPDDQGNIVRLRDLRGQTVVLYMYPKDQTPGCTAQACDFRDNLARIQAAGAVVLGLSPDSVASHKRFKEKYGLTFPLLSDEGGAVASRYGAWVQKSLFGRKFMGIERSTFIIDGDGILRKAFRKVKVRGHVDQVLRALEEIV
ncbi:MAG: thioredoxin-dependent thiol peroxidase [Firmicutes bacterium]|jgi:peroxiredoxin Q/BCP|nr:thioredoxin-dependent thiol peroxidase [Bacillota bacterium]